MSQRVTVGADDLSDLTVQLRPGASRREDGWIPWRERAATHRRRHVRNAVWRARAVRGVGTKGATRSFSTIAAGGRYIVRPYELGGWFVQSVTLDGKDITDRVVTLQATRPRSS
jgi:hypothetical protein